MSTTIYLRIASVLTVVHSILHTIGGVFGKPSPGPQQAVVLAMQTNRFLIMGVMRSLWDTYHGMGLAVGILLAVEGVAFWQLGGLARSHARRLRPILATFVVGYLALAMVSFRYFFAPPMVTELLIALCLGMAIVAAGGSRDTVS